jgi:cyclase
MYRPRIIPCLLLQNKGLVKTIRFSTPTYVGDPINAVRIFNENEADELIFLDINASQEGRLVPIDLVEKIGDEAFMPYAVGGGIRDISDVRAIIKAGAEKVVINSAAIETPELIAQAADIFGSQSIIVSIDARQSHDGTYRVYTHGGMKATGRNPVELAQQMERHGAGEIVINSIDRDGTGEGYDIELIKSITGEVQIPVIAIGGASSLEDFAVAVKEGGASAVAAGSMFVFIGRKRAVLINYPDRDTVFETFR